jgi:hypothetical protein
LDRCGLDGCWSRSSLDGLHPFFSFLLSSPLCLLTHQPSLHFSLTVFLYLFGSYGNQLSLKLWGIYMCGLGWSGCGGNCFAVTVIEEIIWNQMEFELMRLW